MTLEAGYDIVICRMALKEAAAVWYRKGGLQPGRMGHFFDPSFLHAFDGSIMIDPSYESGGLRYRFEPIYDALCQEAETWCKE